MVQFLKAEIRGTPCVEKLYPLFEIFRFERKESFFWTLSEQEKRELKEDIDKVLNL
jgi:cob(I)alamin adenosyltransferase